MNTIKYACIGHRIYFENHFIDGHDSADNIRGFDYNHYSNNPFLQLLAYAPDVTLIFRPELYTARMLRMLPGIKIGFSSEPLPSYDSSEKYRSEETDIRETVYSRLAADAYDFFFHYDGRSSKWFEDRGIKVTGYRPLPIDCSVFYPDSHKVKDIDFLFVGKATPYRIRVLDRLRILPFRFQWIAHGVFGRPLAELIQRAHCVLNIHADGRPQFEPRVLLAAACGTTVLSEPLGLVDFPCREAVTEADVERMPAEHLCAILQKSRVVTESLKDNWPKIRKQLSTLEFVNDCVWQYLQH
jgi:hypothetical protein